MANAKQSKQDKKPLEVIVSPKGTAAYAWCDKPDSGREFSDDKFKITLVLPKEGAENQDEVDAFIEGIEAAHAAARGKKKTASPVKDGDEKGKEEFEGMYLLNFKSTKQPRVVDAKKKPVADGITAFSGDVVKVAFVMVPYAKGVNAGISLGLRAVQIIEKNASFGGGSGGADAFAEEEGFESEDAPKSAKTDGDGDDDADY